MPFTTPELPAPSQCTFQVHSSTNFDLFANVSITFDPSAANEAETSAFIQGLLDLLDSHPALDVASCQVQYVAFAVCTPNE